MNHSSEPSHSQSPKWQSDILEKVALEGIKEQRRSRRWGIFFKFLLVAYLGVALLMFFKGNEKTKGSYDALGKSVEKNTELDSHIAILSLNGIIGDKQGVDAFEFNKELQHILGDELVGALIIRANSPGGSPVQSSLIYQQVMRLKETYKKPVYVVISDVCASGCYYIASAADKIIADASSIVGSIGVISQSFGYADAAQKLGIEPRTFTAGKYKDLLNPAKPLTDKDKMVIQSVLDDLHNNFIDAVKAGRKGKLSNDTELFSGLFWTGNQSLVLGVIDEIGTLQTAVKSLGSLPVYDYDYKTPIEAIIEELGISVEETIQNVINKGLIPDSQFIAK